MKRKRIAKCVSESAAIRMNWTIPIGNITREREWFDKYENRGEACLERGLRGLNVDAVCRLNWTKRQLNGLRLHRRRTPSNGCGKRRVLPSDLAITHTSIFRYKRNAAHWFLFNIHLIICVLRLIHSSCSIEIRFHHIFSKLCDFWFVWV